MIVVWVATVTAYFLWVCLSVMSWGRRPPLVWEATWRANEIVEGAQACVFAPGDGSWLVIDSGEAVSKAAAVEAIQAVSDDLFDGGGVLLTAHVSVNTAPPPPVWTVLQPVANRVTALFQFKHR